ncbi:hypothetical protein JCM10213_006683 [Rhodosporidiobolus nylandii]
MFWIAGMADWWRGTAGSTLSPRTAQPRLPAKLLCLILSQLIDPLDPSTTRRDLHSLALTSHLFRELALPELEQYLVLHLESYCAGTWLLAGESRALLERHMEESTATQLISLELLALQTDPD